MAKSELKLVFLVLERDKILINTFDPSAFIPEITGNKHNVFIIGCCERLLGVYLSTGFKTRSAAFRRIKRLR